jgi:YCII-related domain
MKRFLLLYKGPRPSPPVSHEGWPEWFDKIGDALVDLGSTMVNGFALRGDGSVSDETTDLNGFSIVQAEDRDGVLDLIADHPLVQLGSEYAIEVFEVPRK